MPARRAILLLLLVVLVGFQPLVSVARADNRVDRLVRLAKLYGTLKYVNPYVWEHEVDVDKLVLQTIPKVSAAQSAGEYRAAVAALVTGIGDPVTRIVDPPKPEAPPAADDPGPLTRTDNGVLVVRLRQLPSTAALHAAAVPLRKEILSARTVVFDLRGAGGYAALALFELLGNVVSRRTLVAPAQTELLISGFEPQNEMATSGGYFSGLLVRSAETYAPRPEPPLRRAVFLMNSEAPLVPLALAAVASGDAWLVSEGHLVLEGELGVDMGEGLFVNVRRADLTPAVKADLEVPAGQDALAAALAIARDTRPKKVRVAAAALPPTPRRVRDAPYAETPYPSQDLRLLALFRYWNIVHYFYPYLDLIGDWDAVLPELIPKLEGAGDATAYALAIAELVTRVPDGHSGVRADALQAYLGKEMPPVSVRLVEGQPVIVKAKPEAGVQVGDVIVAIDGEPVARRQERLEKVLSSSTAAARAQRAASLLLAGPLDSKVTVTVKGADAKPRAVELARQPFTPPVDPPKEEVVKILPGNVGYVDLRALEKRDVDAMFTKLADTKAIVFDMRGYPRGTAWSICPRINHKHARTWSHFDRNELIGGEIMHKRFDQEINAWKGPVYDRPTLMLIDDRAISQSEHTGLCFENASGTRFVGSSSAGANGDVTGIVLPGGVQVFMTGQSVRHADGRQLQRVGLTPDIRVEPTLAGIRAGKDEVLEAALRALAAKAPATRK